MGREEREKRERKMRGAIGRDRERQREKGVREWGDKADREGIWIGRE